MKDEEMGGMKGEKRKMTITKGMKIEKKRKK